MEAEFFEKFGLDEKEAKVYFSLIKHKNSSATQISQFTGVDRTLCYTVVERLLSKGIVSFSVIEGVKKFNALNPEVMLQKLKEKTEALEEKLPELKKFFETPEEEKTKVEVLSGKNGMKAILGDILKEGKDYYAYGYVKKWELTIPIKLEKYLKELERKKITEHLLLSKGEKVLEGKTSIVKYLPKKMAYPATTIIYGNKMAITIWTEPITTILIKDKNVVSSHKQHFEFMWEKASKK